jgi:hypothetical protein
MIRGSIRYACIAASVLGGAVIGTVPLSCGGQTVIDVSPDATSHDARADGRSPHVDAPGADRTTPTSDVEPGDGPTDAGLEADVEDVVDGFDTEPHDSGPDDGAPEASCPASDGGYVTLSSGGAPYGIVVSASDLFWADLGGRVLRMSLSDCEVTTIASGQSGTIGVTLAGDDVYFSNNNGGGSAGSIVTVPQTGGTPTTLASGLDSPGLVTNDGESIYWTPGSSDFTGVVYKMALTGGAVTSLASEAYSHDIVTTGGLVYWTDQFAAAVAYVPVGGGSVVTVASDQPIPYFMATDGTNVYWTNSTGGDGGAVMKVAVGTDGGAPVELAAAPDGPTGVTSDGANVYFGSGSTAQVLEVGVNGGTVTTLVEGPTSVARIAVDSKNVYWTDYTHGLVLMTSK